MIAHLSTRNFIFLRLHHPSWIRKTPSPLRGEGRGEGEPPWAREILLFAASSFLIFDLFFLMIVLGELNVGVFIPREGGSSKESELEQ